MNVGNVISNKQGQWVITQVEKGLVAETESLDDFICNNAVVIDSDGGQKTIKEIIENRKRLYLMVHDVIEE